MTNKIKVVHIQLLPLLSGVQKVSLDEFRFINKDLFDLYLITQSQGPFTLESDKLSVSCITIPTLTRNIHFLKDFISLCRLCYYFLKIKPDIVHTHSSKTGVLGRIAAKFAMVPVVIHTVHGFSFDSTNSLLKKKFYILSEYISAFFSDLIIVLKDSDLKIANNLLKIPLKKLTVLPNGISLPDYNISVKNFSMSEKFTLLPYYNPNAVLVGMTGRLWEQKNPECFVNAAIQTLSRTTHPVIFYLIGDGPLRDKLQSTIDKSGYSTSIIILGWRNDVPTILQMLDIFVLSSSWEGLPLSILEAMASSLPVVASDIPGNSDLIDHGINGFLFPKGDSTFLSNYILELINTKLLRSTFGISGRNKITYSYNIIKRINQIESIYTYLIFRK